MTCTSHSCASRCNARALSSMLLSLVAGAGDLLLEDNAMQTAPRPGTSLSRPITQSSTSAAMRPMTQSGRPTTGFARPGTSARPPTGSGVRQGTAQRVATALRGNKPGTARPTTTSGRYVRLGTASLASQAGGPFIDVQRLNMEKYAQRKHLARVLCDYLVYNEHNAKIAATLCKAAMVCLLMRPQPRGLKQDCNCCSGV